MIVFGLLLGRQAKPILIYMNSFVLLYKSKLVFFFPIEGECTAMKIDKIINNNIVSCIDNDGKEIVVMGRGIGFGTKSGKVLKEDKIEKIFIIDDESGLEKFKELLRKMPLEHIEVSAEIISYAKSVLNRRLNENIYITLTDHISFAIQRFKNGIQFSNPLLNDVKTFYKEEYLIGEYAVRLIEQKLKLKLSSAEAGFIALHIVNAEYTSNMRDITDITNLIHNAVEIVKDYFSMNMDEESLDYQRFITHLRFLAQRVIADNMLNSDNIEFNTLISGMYPEEYKCSIKIKEYIKEAYDKEVTDEETIYLAVHIKRLRMI